jgi:hypothetical protein
MRGNFSWQTQIFSFPEFVWSTTLCISFSFPFTSSSFRTHSFATFASVTELRSGSANPSACLSYHKGKRRIQSSGHEITSASCNTLITKLNYVLISQILQFLVLLADPNFLPVILFLLLHHLLLQLFLLFLLLH